MEDEKSTVEEGSLNSSEEAFMKGYDDEEKIPECEECGSRIDEEQILKVEIDGEEHIFCTKVCAQEYEESLATE